MVASRPAAADAVGPGLPAEGAGVGGASANSPSTIDKLQYRMFRYNMFCIHMYMYTHIHPIAIRTGNCSGCLLIAYAHALGP